MKTIKFKLKLKKKIKKALFLGAERRRMKKKRKNIHNFSDGSANVGEI